MISHQSPVRCRITTCAALAALLLLSGCTKPAAEEAAPPEEAAKSGEARFEGESLALAGIKTAPAEERSLAPVLTVTGRVEPTPGGVVRVTSRVAGRVVRLSATVGDLVRPGMPLAVVESERLHEAQLAHQLSVKRTAFARRTLTRRRELARLGAFASPERETARVRLTDVDASVSAARSDVETRRAALVEADGEITKALAALAAAQSRQDAAKKRSDRAATLLKEEIIARQEAEQTEAEYRQTVAETDVARAVVAQAQSARGSAATRLAAARAALQSAQKQQTVAKGANTRAEAVYQGGYATSREIVEAQSVLEQAEIEEAGALDDVILIGGKPGDLHEVPVLAPAAGRVTARGVSIGESVNNERPLFELLASDVVSVTLDVFPADIARIRVGQAVSFTADAVEGRTLTGRVAQIAPAADETTPTVKVRCTVANAGGLLRPGTFVTATVRTGDSTRLAVPKDAVQEMDGKSVVFVPGSETGTFVARPVTTGETVNGYTVIESGLKPGEVLVVKNAFVAKSQSVKSELAEE